MNRRLFIALLVGSSAVEGVVFLESPKIKMIFGEHGSLDPTVS